MAPSSDCETVGFIDVGTNSIHLLVVRFFPETSGTAIYQDKETVRLGKSLYSTGRIDEESIRKSALVIDRFAQISRSLGASKVIAFATCAAREAENRQDLLDAVSKDVNMQVIPGIEEARLIALGVFGDMGPSERTIEIDIGGGSTEVIIREKGEDIFLDSLSMGAVRYNYSMGIDFSKPVSRPSYSHLLRSVDISSYHAVNKIRSLGFRKAVASSGTAIALAEACANRRGDKDASYFTLEELHDLMIELCKLDASGRQSVAGIGKSRSDIIIPGGAIAEELMSQFGIDRIEISTSGLKQGMMYDYQLSRGGKVFDARISSVKALASRCQYDMKHANNVERNAVSIFDQTRALGLHSLDSEWRSLLSCSAQLHDIGELISYTNHSVISQMIIEKADLRGFNCEEIHDMGLIVRSHHKKFPGFRDARFEGLPKNEISAIRICAIILKMADSMDRHRNGAVRAVKVGRDKDGISLHLSVDEDPSMEIWSLEKLRPDFKKVFGMEMLPPTSDWTIGRYFRHRRENLNRSRRSENDRWDAQRRSRIRLNVDR